MKIPLSIFSAILFLIMGAVSGGEAQAQTAVTEQVMCQSDGFNRNRCKVDGEIANVTPLRRLSGAQCVQGNSWGYRKRHVWVDHGCAALFEVTYWTAAAQPMPEPEPQAEPAQAAESGSAALPSGDRSGIVAQSMCSAMFGIVSAGEGIEGGGFAMAVPRTCNSQSTLTCAQICANAGATSVLADQIARRKNRQCLNAIHVYKSEGAVRDERAESATYVYNDCNSARCGPNYCCCTAY